MTLEQYLNSDALKRAIEDYAENAKLETAQKTITNFQTIAASAYNEGVVEMISKGKPVKKGSLEKSKELTKMLPDQFVLILVKHFQYELDQIVSHAVAGVWAAIFFIAAS